MQYASIKSERLKLGIAGLSACFLALLWTNVWHLQVQDRKETINAALERNTNLAVALEQFAISTIGNAEAGLDMLQLEFENRGANIDIGRLLGEKKINSDIFKGIGLVGWQGQVIKSSTMFDLDALLQTTRLSRESSKTDSVVQISKPVASVKMGSPVINFYRTLWKNGMTQGLIVIQVLPETFTSFYDQANLLEHDIISLIAPDGITYARRTGTIQSSGENISSSPLFTHVRNNPDSFYLARDAIRGIPTYFSYRSIEDYRMIATVGRAEQDVLAGFYQRKKRDLLSGVTISVLIVLFSFFVLQLLLQRKRTAEAQVAAEKRYQQQLTEEIISAQEKEREVIGHELHDNVNQVLTTVKLYLQLIRQDYQTHVKLVDKSSELLQSAINDIRNLSHRLSTPILGTRSIVDSIKALADSISATAAISVKFNHSSYRAHLLPEQKLGLYRIVQEQMSNVIKHSGASEVVITLEQDAEFTILTVWDNGKGFDVHEKRNGIGLKNMSTRTAALNGKMEIQSSPGDGCLLKVTLPIMNTVNTQ